MIPTIQPTKPLSRFDPNRPDPNLFGKQAYACTHDANFAKFAAQQKPDATFDYVHHAAEFICAECGVTALRFIDDTSEAIAKWQGLNAKYQDWLNKQNV
jgi:hypothetical protein